MSDEQNTITMSVNRRQAIGGAAVVAGSMAMPAWATSASDRRLSTFEGKYAVGGHKVVDGYFAAPRGAMNMDVLVVIPGENGVDDAVRDLVRRHALAGNVAFAPDLAKTYGKTASRDAMIADFVAHAPRLKSHARGNGVVRLVAA